MSSCHYDVQGHYQCIESFGPPQLQYNFPVTVLGCENTCKATGCDSSQFEKAKCKTIMCPGYCTDKSGTTLNDCNKPSSGKPNCLKNKQTNVPQPFKLDINNKGVNIPGSPALLYDNPSNPLAASYINAYNLYMSPKS
jgi:hypothetical protein